LYLDDCVLYTQALGDLAIEYAPASWIGKATICCEESVVLNG
jgi:hypothetical protein